MNIRVPENRRNNAVVLHGRTINSSGIKASRAVQIGTIAVLAAVTAVSLSACGGLPSNVQAGATESASSTPSPTPTPTPTPTAPKTTSCITENAKESYPPKEFICTRNDAGALVWMEKSESVRVTEARAAAAAKAAAEKAAAEKAAAEKAAAKKAAAEQAAAEKAAAEQAAAQAAAAAQAKAAQEAAAAEAARRQAAAPPPAAPSGCDPNYSGCVPIASDVDCAGGSGNGPAYVNGPIGVTGSDVYRLDSDGDGIACE